MKKIAVLIIALAATASFTQPAFAEDNHQHEHSAQAAQGSSEKMSDHENTMQESMKKMHDQMEAIKQAKEPAERQKLLQEHSESMLGSMKMMREMIGGMTMGGGMGSCHKMHSHPKSQHGGDAASHNTEQMAIPDKSSDKSAKKLWVCPMHPEVVQDHPETCPICGMDLVEIEQSGTSQSAHEHKMDGCMMGGMMEKQMEMMLMLMEQMMEHNNAEMAVQK